MFRIHDNFYMNLPYHLKDFVVNNLANNGKYIDADTLY